MKVEGYSRFAKLEIQNKVVFESKVPVSVELKALDNVSITNGENIYLVDKAIISGGNWGYELGVSSGWEMQQDLIIEKSLYVYKDTLNLNEKKLTVRDDVIQTGGTIDVNKGTMMVNGNYGQSGGTLSLNEGSVSIGKNYSITGDSYLDMTKEKDILEVNGDFTMASGNDHRGKLIAGEMKLKGNVYQRNGSYWNFYPTGNHKVILNGESEQKVKVESYSRFARLEIANYSAGGVNLVSDIPVTTELALVDKNMRVLNERRIYLEGTAVISGGVWAKDISIKKDWTMQQDQIIEGNLYLDGGTLDLNGRSLTIGKDLIQTGGKLSLNNGSVNIGGNYSITGYSYLEMIKANDRLNISGNFTMNSKNDHESCLKQGIMDIKGDFLQNHVGGNQKNFKSNDQHKVILSGTGIQKVEFTSPSSSNFNILALTKPIETGYIFSNTNSWNTIVPNYSYPDPVNDDVGNDFASAKPISVGSVYPQSFESMGDIDVFSIVPDTTGGYIIRSTGNADTVGILYDGSKNQIASNDNGSDGHNFTITYKLESGKTYYVFVKHANFTGMGSYGILIEADSTPPVINKFIPSNFGRINKDTKISAVVTDDVGVESVEFYHYALDKWNLIGRNSTGTITWNMDGIADGDCKIKVIATDSSGNKSEAFVNYTIDNTAPALPQISASASELKVNLLIEQVSRDEDFYQYKIYRSSDDINYKCIGVTDSLLFVDYEAPSNKYSYYYITALDNLGNEGNKSNIVMIMPGPDVSAPVIDQFNPADGSSIRGTARFTLHAKDNMGVNEYTVYYRKLDQYNKPEGEGRWIKLSSITNVKGDAIFNWNTAELNVDETRVYPDGKFELKVTASDVAGNLSERTQIYAIENNPPSPPDGLWVASGEWKLVVSWKPTERADFDHYILQRKVGKDGQWKTIVEKTTANMYIDKGMDLDSLLDPQNEFYYRVACANDLGFQSEYTRDYSLDNDSQDKPVCKPLEETSSPIVYAFKPSEFTKTNKILNLEALVGDEVGVIVKYEYSYLGEDTDSTITGSETWIEIGMDFKPVRKGNNYEEIIEQMIDGKKPSNLVWSQEGFLSKFTWDASLLTEGTYAVRVTAINKGNKESKLIKKFILDKSLPNAPESLAATDTKCGGEVLLEWKASNSDDVDIYNVYMSEQNDTGYIKIGSTAGLYYKVSGLVNNKTYYFTVRAVDLAGNESQPCLIASKSPSWLSDLELSEIKFNPDVPTYNRQINVIATVNNKNVGKASGTVEFFREEAGGWISLGITNVQATGLGYSNASISWIPENNIPSNIKIKAIVRTTDQSKEDSVTNNELVVEKVINKAPDAIINTKTLIPSGQTFTLSGKASQDSDGYIDIYQWDLGDGTKKEGSEITHAFQNPGNYNITLKTIDNNKAETRASVSVSVYENRPDLVISDILWTPDNPIEKDLVNIKATIKNIGRGTSTLGFLVGFYIDNKYVGYTRVTDNIPVGGSKEVDFSWVATPGIHVLKVVANDILDNLKELDKTNNEMIKALTTQQVNFPDVKIDSIAYDPSNTTELNSEEPFKYTVTVSNIGNASAKNFFVSLYIDGKWHAKQIIESLDPQTTDKKTYGTATFVMKPMAGSHVVTAIVDDPVPVLIEKVRDNNSLTITTPSFKVITPEIEIIDFDWLPKETTLADGMSYMFSSIVRNKGNVNITHPFNIEYIVDGSTIKTITIEKLGIGEEFEVRARWQVKPGKHVVKVIADRECSVTKSVYLERQIDNITVVYPELKISDVKLSKTNIVYGDDIVFNVSVSNNSVTSIFKSFNIGLYMDDNQVASYTLNGLRGNSTTEPIQILYKVTSVGEHTFKIIIDPKNEIKDEANDLTQRSWSQKFVIKDTLIADFYPSKDDGDDSTLEVLFTSACGFIPLKASVRKASSSKLLGPESNVSVYYQIFKYDNGEWREIVLRDDGKPNTINFDRLTGTFNGQIAIGNSPGMANSLTTGSYKLKLTASDNIQTVSEECIIRIVEDIIANVEVDKEVYQLWNKVKISGKFMYKDGRVLAGTKILIDLQLEPQTGDGLKPWKEERIISVETGKNGEFNYEFTPGMGQAGLWHVQVSPYKSLFASMATTEFEVLGLVASPSNIDLIASKNSTFSKVITIRNAADGGNTALTGISADLTSTNKNTKVKAVLDTSTLKKTLGPGESSSVIVNFYAPLDSEDTELFQVVFSSTGKVANAVSNIKLNLRPAIPKPVTDPQIIKIGLNPGTSMTKTVTITNKGLGTMSGIKLEGLTRLTWAHCVNLGKDKLLPGESTTFEIIFNPPKATALGQYQDELRVTDGKYSAIVTIGVEVCSSETGSLSFLVLDNTGSRVEDAEVVLVGRVPMTRQIGDQKEVYYNNYIGKTDSKGIVTFDDKPLGEYTYYISAQGRRSTEGTAYVMPASEATVVNVTMTSEPVSIQWMVKPVTIEDKYDVIMNIDFIPNIPDPEICSVPPWLTILKQVTAPIYVEATVVNSGLINITDVSASIIRESAGDIGISIVGGGYIGEIPAHGTAKIKLMILPGYYSLRPGLRSESDGIPFNYIKLHANFMKYDKDTGLPIDPPADVFGIIPLYNPGEKIVKTEALLPNGMKVSENICMPDGDDFEEIDLFGGGGTYVPKDNSTNEVVSLKLSQTATIERQAFDATLKVGNGYVSKPLQNLSVRVVITDENGKDVTSQNYIIPTGVEGIGSVDGSCSLSSGRSMTAKWQIIPGDGLGGTLKEGKTYYAKAIVSYALDGVSIETQTVAEAIKILPQPKIKLHYYIPGKIKANEPFRLGVIAENIGDGIAKNLTIESGQLNVTTKQSDLIKNFVIIGTSFGSSTDNTFKLNLGDIDPHSRVSGYWIVKWVMNEEREGKEPLEGVFKDFNASLNHRDYMGVKLNPLIVEVTTEIIGKDNVVKTKEGKNDENSLALIDEKETGIPSYLLDFKTGMKLPIYVPEKLNVIKQPDEERPILKFEVPVLEGDPASQNVPRYQVLMLKDPSSLSSIHSVTRVVYGQPDVVLSGYCNWKNNGNIYIVDEIPVVDGKYVKTSYFVDFSSGIELSDLGYSQIAYKWQPDDEPIMYDVYYDIGHYPDEVKPIYDEYGKEILSIGTENITKLRVKVTNTGMVEENGKVEFFASKVGSQIEERIGEVLFTGLEPLSSKFLYKEWTPKNGGTYKLIARISGSQGKNKIQETTLKVNYLPEADAGPSFKVDVLKSAHFDGSKSYDKDGYIQNLIWEFGDGESGHGVTTNHIYKKSGTYKVKLTAIDDNNSSYTDTVVIEVNETRPDLVISQIKVSNEKPLKDQKVTVSATVYNRNNTSTENPFLVCFYVDDKYQNFIRITDKIGPKESKNVTFEWVCESGGHTLTVTTNDMGHAVDEADFNNNSKSIILGVDETSFPNVITTSVNIGFSGTYIGWNQEINIKADIKNDGTKPSDKFNVALYVDDEFIEAKKVAGLSNMEGSNTYTVDFTWRVKSKGIHKIKVYVDGPINHIAETDESDNELEITTGNYKLLYPDIIVDSLEITPNNISLKPGETMALKADLVNNGYTDVNNEFKVSFYADNYYIGNASVKSLAKSERINVSVIWERPIEGVKVFKVIADSTNVVPEVSLPDKESREYLFMLENPDSQVVYEEDSNTFTINGEENNDRKYTLDSPLKVSMPDLEIIGIENVYDNEKPVFGDEIISLITIQNTGNAAISRPFENSLYINDKLAGKFVVGAGLAPGEIITGNISWKADFKPTGNYKMAVYADSQNSLYLRNRSHSKLEKDFKVKGALQLNPDMKSTYTVNEDMSIGLEITSTDAPWMQLQPKDNVSAAVYFYNGKVDINGDPIGNLITVKQMDYSVEYGKFVIKGITPEDLNITKGSFTAIFDAQNLSVSKSVYRQISVVDDYIVTVTSSKQTYDVGQPIAITGKVTKVDGITPIADVTVLIKIVGEEEWSLTAKTNSSGIYNAEFKLPKYYGGSYNLSATAKLEGTSKKSESKVFYVEGVVLSISNSVYSIAGKVEEISATLINVGTVDAHNINISKILGTNAEGYLVDFVGNVPESLAAGESAEFKVRVNIPQDASLIGKEIKFKVATKEGHITESSIRINIDVAKPEYRVSINSEFSPDETGVVKSSIIATVRPGEEITHFVNIMNTGNAPITDIRVTPPAKLPWVYITIAGTDIVEPLNKVESIKDVGAKTTIFVNINPDEYVRPGQYDDVIKINSNIGEISVPIKLTVGYSNVGTAVIELIDEDSIPVKDAKLQLIGPMANGDKVPDTSEVYEGVKQEVREGNTTFTAYRFENIPAGTYTLHAEANGFKPLEKTINIQALIDLVPQKHIMEMMPFMLDWNIETFNNFNETNIIDGTEPNIILDNRINFDYENPKLVTDFPGYELYYSDMLLNMFKYVSVKNPSVYGTVYNVQAEIINIDDKLPVNGVYLNVGQGRINTTRLLNLGDIQPNQVKDFKIRIDDTSFFDDITIEPTANKDEYTIKASDGITTSKMENWFSAVNTYSKTVQMETYNPDTKVYTIKLVAGSDGTVSMPDKRVPKLDNKRYIFDMDLRLKGQVVNWLGKTQEITTTVPVRMHYNPYSASYTYESPFDEMKTQVVSAFVPERYIANEKEFYPQNDYSKNFLARIGSSSDNELEQTGEALGSFDFKQDAILADEVTNASFTLYNPSPIETLQDAEVKIIITNMEMDSEGRLPEGGMILNDRFNISSSISDDVRVSAFGVTGNTDNTIYVLPPNNIGSASNTSSSLYTSSVAPGSKKVISYNIQRKKQEQDYEDTNSTLGKAYVYIQYQFSKGGKSYRGITKPKEAQIEPPAKIYISYETKAISDNIFEITVKATNAGLGKAKNLKLLPPTIKSTESIKILEGQVEDGPWIEGLSYLVFGDIQPGETVLGKYKIYSSKRVDIGLSTTFGVISESSSGKVVLTPLAFNNVTSEASFSKIETELKKLKKNIANLLDKTQNDLSRPFADAIELTRDIDDTVNISKVLDILNSGFGVIYKSISMFLDARSIMSSKSNKSGDINNTIQKNKVVSSQIIQGVTLSKLGIAITQLIEKLNAIEAIVDRTSEYLGTLFDCYSSIEELKETISGDSSESAIKLTQNVNLLQDTLNQLESPLKNTESKMIDIKPKLVYYKGDLVEYKNNLKKYEVIIKEGRAILDEIGKSRDKVDEAGKQLGEADESTVNDMSNQERKANSDIRKVQDSVNEYDNKTNSKKVKELGSKVLKNSQEIMSLIKKSFDLYNALNEFNILVEDYKNIVWNYEYLMHETENSIVDSISGAEDDNAEEVGEGETAEEEETVEEFERSDLSNVSVLFTGDAARRAEADMVNTFNGTNVLQSDILKVAHHGSDTSSSALFLENVRPKDALISTNGDNHNFLDTIGRLNEITAEVNSTTGSTTPYSIDSETNMDRRYGPHIYATNEEDIETGTSIQSIVTNIIDQSTNIRVARVTMYNVEDGDCILVETDIDPLTNTSRKMLIDAGSGRGKDIKAENLAYFNPIEEIDRLDYLVITHPHADHYNYIKRRLASGNPLSIDRILIPDISNTSRFANAYSELLTAFNRMGYNVQRVKYDPLASPIYLGSNLEFSVLGPVRDYSDFNISSLNNKQGAANDSSIVLKMTYVPRTHTVSGSTVPVSFSIPLGSEVNNIPAIADVPLNYNRASNDIDEKPRTLKVVTCYTFRKDGKSIVREEVQELLYSYSVDLKETSKLISKEQDSRGLVENLENFKKWNENILDTLKKVKFSNEDDIKQKLGGVISLDILQQIINNTKDNINERIRLIAYQLLSNQQFEIITIGSILNSYENYLYNEPYDESPYEDVDYGDFDVSPGMTLKTKTEIRDLSSLRTVTDRMIDQAIEVIEGYYWNNDCPAYYPADVLVQYLEELNKQIESVAGTEDKPYKGPGRYNNISIFNSNSDEVHPEVKELKFLNNSYVKMLKDVTTGYGIILDRAESNMLKGTLYSIDAIWEPTLIAMSYNPFSSQYANAISKIYDKYYGESISTIKENEVHLMNQEKNTVKKIGSDLANMITGSGIAFSREISIAESVKDLIVNIDRWRKIDPPIPVDIISVSVPDMVSKANEKYTKGEAVIVLKNLHSGEITVQVDMDIYGAQINIGSFLSEQYSIMPGEIKTIKVPFEVQRSTMIDVTGYKGIVTINMSEPGTMTLGQPKGPYINTFYSGTEAQLRAFRNQIKVSQPMGKQLKAGEQEEILYTVGDSTKDIRILFAAGINSTAEMHIYDKYGKHIGYGLNSIFENNILESQILSLRKSSDMIIIRNPVNGPYKIVVKLPEGEKDQEYSLEITEVKNLGAVPDVDAVKFVICDTKKPEFNINVYESSFQNNIENVRFDVLGFEDMNGKPIEIISSTFKSQGGEELVGGVVETGIPSGKVASVVGSVEFNSGLPNGWYIGKVRVTVKGKNLNPNFGYFTENVSVTEEVYGWQYKAGSNTLPYTTADSEYFIDLPIAINIDTTIPTVPEIKKIERYQMEGRGYAHIKGNSKQKGTIEVYLDGKISSKVDVKKDLSFESTIDLKPGKHMMEIVSVNELGVRSTDSYITDIIALDCNSPQINPVLPKYGETLHVNPKEIKFDILDNESGVDVSTLIVSLDGKVVPSEKLVDCGEGRWILLVDTMVDGTHSITASVYDNVNNKAEVSWNFIVDTVGYTDASISSDIYTIDQNAYKITNIPYGTTVSNFLSNIKVNRIATLKLLEADKITQVIDGVVNTGMFLEVTAGDKITKKIFNIKNDDIKPSIPTGLKLISKTADSVIIEWSSSSDNMGVSGYEVYRSGTKLGSIAGTVYEDTNLIQGTVYVYTVRAFDRDYNLSDSSTDLSVIIDDTQAPTVPTGLKVDAKTESTVIISWIASTDNVGVAGYEIYRDGVKIANVTGTVYADSGLNQGTSYVYTVKAYDAANNITAASEGLSVTTTNLLSLNPVGNKTANEGQTLKFTLSVTTSEGKAVNYSALNLPEGATINSETGEFAWTPSVGQAGTYNIRFQASDGKDTDYEDVTITVVKNCAVPEDITQDGVVNMTDVIALAKVFGTTSKDPNFDSRCDLNNDGTINMSDVIKLALRFGYSYKL